MTKEAFFRDLVIEPKESWLRCCDEAFKSYEVNKFRFSSRFLQKWAEEAGLCEEQRRELSDYAAFLAGDRTLSMFAWLLCYVVNESDEAFGVDIKDWPLPGRSEQRFPGVLWAVVMLASVDYLKLRISRAGLTADILRDFYDAYRGVTAGSPFGGVAINGHYGIVGDQRHYSYARLMLRLVLLGRLNFEIRAFGGPYEVYRLPDGSSVPLALPNQLFTAGGLRAEGDDAVALVSGFCERGGALAGYTWGADGHLDPKPLTLPAGGWEKYVSQGDPAINIHIPGGKPLLDEEVQDSFRQAEAFFAKVHPQHDFRTFMCSSWLLDTGLKEFLPQGSNILKFQRNFRIAVNGVHPTAIFSFAFGVRPCELSQLTPKNDFQRRLLEYVKAGGRLYSGFGYRLIEK